jgi:transposase
MIGLSNKLHYYLCTQPTDMRNGFDGLAGIVRNFLIKDPISGDVFVFLNKTRSHIKLLYWDGDGFAMYYKRLERGRYKAQRAGNGQSIELKRDELMMLLEGLSFSEMRKSKRFKIG